MFFAIGTEEETGGDGTGEVSTGVESKSVVRRRRTVVTKRQVTLAGGPSIVSLRPAQARKRLTSSWRRPLMRVYFVLTEKYSSNTPRLLRFSNSCFPVLDQHYVDPSSSVI